VNKCRKCIKSVIFMHTFLFVKRCISTFIIFSFKGGVGSWWKVYEFSFLSDIELLMLPLRVWSLSFSMKCKLKLPPGQVSRKGRMLFDLLRYFERIRNLWRRKVKGVKYRSVGFYKLYRSIGFYKLYRSVGFYKL
jgi:hypothetical protein